MYLPLENKKNDYSKAASLMTQAAVYARFTHNTERQLVFLLKITFTFQALASNKKNIQSNPHSASGMSGNRNSLLMALYILI
jgi:hypothetical protein